MANANAKELIASIPECVSGCFENGVAATGCDTDDYDCYCYANNHQTIVDTMYTCLDNKERKLDVSCTDDEMFQMENRYWMVCQEYWEPTGTATEPASATITSTKSTKTTTSSTRITSTKITSAEITSTSSSQLTLVTSTSSLKPSTVDIESSKSTETPSNQDTDGTATGLSTGAKAGIGIGVALGVVLLAISIFLWIRERRKRRQLEGKLAEANEASLVRGMGYVNEKGDIYEMEGDRPYVEEMPAGMRTPELSGMSYTSPTTQGPGSLKSVSTIASVSSDSSLPRFLSPAGAFRPDVEPKVLSAELDITGRPLR
ncbi:hypothetical protein G7Z17_g11741 [Cylindrodendrum hubeiense]|uniref:CFEM domain-containing protein n=1 Tax=Cylindrodendrum hubeiense TaxID=595255 RepID=A0A9P5L3P5_9HYPO|nr:hypothetical protein G7Z17_g11741 [Cylindrodendrum hubeiense]